MLPLMMAARPTANCWSADLTLIKLPLFSGLAAAVMIAFGDIILPVAKIKNNVVKVIAKDTGTTLRFVIKIVGTKDRIINVVKTRMTPYLSVIFPMIGDDIIVASPPKKN